MRPVLTNLLVSCCSLLVAFALAEALLRVLPLRDFRVLSAFMNPPPEAWVDPSWGNPGSGAYRRHEVLGYEHAPGVELTVPLAEHAEGVFRFRTNNLGLRRDTDSSFQKPPDLFRILLLGDSQTDGYVDNAETFSALLESSLTSRLAVVGKRVEVLNAGVVGYSPAQEFLWYKLWGIRLNPDLVLVVFYVGNDIVELRDPSKPMVDPATGRAIRPLEGGGLADPDRFAFRPDKSHLVALVRYAIQVGPLAEPWRKLGLPSGLTKVGGFQMNTLIQVLRTCHGCFWQSLQQIAYAHRDPQGFREDVHTVGELLVRLSHDVHANGSRLAVAMLPTRTQVEFARARPELHSVAALLGLSESDYALDDEVARAILHQLSRAGVITLSLHESLSAAAQSRPLYYSRDWHLNTFGHQVVASALRQQLLEKLLPTPSH